MSENIEKMGSCGSNTKVLPGLPQASKLNYPPEGCLRIARRKSNDGVLLGYEKVNFKLKHPILNESMKVTVRSRELWTSVCVIPGQDPHNVYPKECQDTSFVTCDNCCLLLGLYDGHGPFGQAVVNFCVDVTNRLFKTRRTEMFVKPN